MLRPVLSLLVSAFCAFVFVFGDNEAKAQQFSGESFARDFRSLVVKVKTTWESGLQQDGFGFVVGHNSTGAYIVTANHVVRGRGPGEVAKSVEVTWFHRRGEQFPATLIGTADAKRDIAVLRTELPVGVTISPDLLISPAAPIQRGTKVWFIGRAGEWYVPFQSGIVNSVDLDDQILIDGLNVQVGTSGAPLTTAEGVAGIIIEDAGGVTRATSIGFIARAFQAWAHPWDIKTITPTDDPPPTPEPEPAPAPAGARSEWFVFLGSFPHSGLSDARKLKNRAEQFFPGEAIIIDTDLYSNLTNGLYSVVIGAGSRSEAQEIRKQAQRLVSDAYFKQAGAYSGP